MSRTYERCIPTASKVKTTVCQYCAVGCGYRAFLLPQSSKGQADDKMVLAPAYVSPAMRSSVRYGRVEYRAAVVPDPRCDLNRGNHSVRGGSAGGNLVTADGKDVSTRERLASPAVRCADGTLSEITWDVAAKVMGHLTAKVTSLVQDDSELRAKTPNRLGVKIFEYQYLENTYVGTKLFYRAVNTANVAYHDRPSVAGSSPGVKDSGFRPHDFSYEDIRTSDVVLIVGSNPYENQSVLFMQHIVGKELIVLDPRRTPTAQYAVDTGGLHLQPIHLGADSLVLYAIARELLGSLNEDDIHPRIHRTVDATVRQAMAGDGLNGAKLRRASRALGLKEFMNWLGVGRPDSQYSLERAAKISGIDLTLLQEAVRRLRTPPKGSRRRPIVATLYEKGLMWGFNYHNTAAVASLGLVLWQRGQPAPLTGRCGGHQKGWAVATRPVPGFGGTAEEGYPFKNSGDRYTDEHLQNLFKETRIPNWHAPKIRVHHNLDSHVFGPDEIMLDTVPPDAKRVDLKNGVETATEPDVRLLWIIGGNYLGQTHAASWKRAKLEDRVRVGSKTKSPQRPKRPAAGTSLDANTILDALAPRVEAEGGLVVVHQDIFVNPTTGLADLILPAAGWGEDDFVRYNGERRLRLYERFQDPPLHPRDDERVAAAETNPFATGVVSHPLPAKNVMLAHSPKPDWVIFRDVARAMIDAVAPNSEAGKAAKAAFAWTRTSEVADEMACESHRSPMLGPLYHFGCARGVRHGEVVHRVMGLGEEGEAPLLRDFYSVPGGSSVQGNGVATNGVLLPVTLVSDPHGAAPRLEGSLRRQLPPGEMLNFVQADWREIEPWFNSFQPDPGEIALTCGRVNHLWNNLYHHVRNEYVAERYPASLPGPILEVNPAWAAKHNFANGEIVDVVDGEASFVAVISRQDSVVSGAGFAIFSFPVRSAGKFTFTGYANNVMNGYWDGMNCIGALKYARARVVPRGRQIFHDRNRQGPTYAQRNRIVALPLTDDLRPGLEPGLVGGHRQVRRWHHERRLDWRMRELIVTKGLPRTFIHSGDARQASLLLPDQLFAYLRTHLRGIFPMMLAAMQWPRPEALDPGRFDRWDGVDLHFARDVWGRSVELDAIDQTAPTPLEVDREMLDRFIVWSEALTGFTDLRDDRDLASSMYSRLRLHSLDVRRRLEALMRRVELRIDGPPPDTCELTLADPELAELTTILWYTGTFVSPFGFPDETFGSILDDHYRKALIWRAIQAPPPGYSMRMEAWWKVPEDKA